MGNLSSRQGAVASAILVAVLVVQLLVTCTNGPVSAAPKPSGGRTGPPQNSTQWDITALQNITQDTDFSGNITVYANAELRIANGARVRILPDACSNHMISVKAGGSVQVENGSVLEADQFQAESGTGFNVRNGSTVKAQGLLEAMSSCFINDSNITVTGASGASPGKPGSSARLVLSPGGQIRNCNITVTAGDGASGGNATGVAGGTGGDAALVMASHEFRNVSVTLRAGRGGSGGTSGGTSIPGGNGGRGGNLSLQMIGELLTDSSIKGWAGNGGNGSAGASSGGINAGNGGPGGAGGPVDFRWDGKGLTTSNSNITLIGGNAGHGGDGGAAQSSMNNGGNGGDGSTGGSNAASIISQGAFAISGSELNFWAGNGSAGGFYGRSMTGMDGRAGDGGKGGSAVCMVNLSDNFSGTQSSLFALAGDGGSGGAGSIGARGGTGASSNLTVSVTRLNSEPAMDMLMCSLTSRAGNGGNGGRGQGWGSLPGQPGDGGSGGRAALDILCDVSFRMKASHLNSDEGLGGQAESPGKAGVDGECELLITAKSVLMTDSSYSQTMGSVDGEDYWRLESTRLVPYRGPARIPHFLPVTGAGVAEEYWRLSCNVKDVNGGLINDGSATVEVFLDETAIGAQRTNSLGKADFLLLGARYLADPDETFEVRTYKASAVGDDGSYSHPVSVALAADTAKDLILLSVRFPPDCTIESPNDKLTPVLDAADYLRDNGTAEPLNIQGTAADSILNPVRSIYWVEVKVGENGDWLKADLMMPSFNTYLWNFSWDIHSWAQDRLAEYPLGVIPCPIYARSNNGRMNSPVAIQNMTVFLIHIPHIPPPPPEIEIFRPVHSNATDIGYCSIPCETPMTFEGRLVRSYGTHVVRITWCFNDTNGFREDYSTASCWTVNNTYPRETAGSYLFVILKVYDNESARRVELLRARVPYSRFGYDFDQTDGSVIVKLRIYVIEPPPAPINDHRFDPSLLILGAFMMLVIFVVILWHAFKGRPK